MHRLQMLPIAGMALFGVFRFFQEPDYIWRLAYVFAISLLIISMVQVEFRYRKKQNSPKV